jgi:hypothetical protein
LGLFCANPPADWRPISSECPIINHPSSIINAEASSARIRWSSTALS